MKVLITGATGFLGYHTVKAFKKAGWKVYATDTPSADFSEIKADADRLIPKDLVSDPLNDLVKDVDIVVHIAGMFNLDASPTILYNVNVKATGRLCAVSVGKVARFIHISTTGVYGIPAKIPCREEDPKRPRNIYEITKLQGETIVQDFIKHWKLPAVILRPTLIYGPRSKYGYAMLVGLFSLLKAQKLKDKKDIPIIKGGIKTHSVHVEDVARAILFFAKRSEGGIFNVADDTPCSFEELIKYMLEPMGIEAKPKLPAFIAAGLVKLAVAFFLRRPDLYQKLKDKVLELWDEELKKHGMSSPLRPRLDIGWSDYFAGDFIYDTTKIKTLGFKLKYPDVKKGLKKTVKWYKEASWIL